MKRHAFLLIIFLGFGSALFADSPTSDPVAHYAPDLPYASFMYTVDIPTFQKKCTQPLPKWMSKRIKEDYLVFEKNGISQDALEHTYAKMLKVLDVNQCARYRIINRKIYRQGADGSGMDAFFRTIARLCDYPGIPNLPNVDFIYSQEDITPCEYHPQTFWYADSIELQAPVFTYAKNKSSRFLILVPDRFTVATWDRVSKEILEVNKSVSWENKRKKAIWRGGPNDFAKLQVWENSMRMVEKAYSKMPRLLISKMSQQHPALVDAGFSDVGFFHTPTIEEFIRPYMKNRIAPSDHVHYAYLPTLDGLTATYPGYAWRLLSNSVAFKQDSPDIQWFYDALMPYMHYIPIKNDLSDLIEQILWAKIHDRQCKEIGKNATEFVLSNLMMEDIYLYFLNILYEHCSLQNFYLPALEEETENDPRWRRIR